MNDAVVAPSGWRIEQAMAAWQSARARLLAEDTDLAADEAALAELLGPEEGDVRDILRRCLLAALHAASMADAAARRIEDMRGRQDRYRRRGEQARATAFAMMEALGERKVELPDCTATISAPRPGVMIVDADALPGQFVRLKREPDKAAIGAALKAGETVAGAELANGMPSLQIRTK